MRDSSLSGDTVERMLKGVPLAEKLPESLINYKNHAGGIKNQ
jgi:hypothetical protein